MVKNKSKDIVLSFCIPTYNRAGFLSNAIGSIVKQITDDISGKVEICISDNASTDDTYNLVMKWQKISPIPIIYHKNNINLNFARNLLSVVKMASGKYSWLLGDDDIIAENGIVKILNEISKNDDSIGIYYCNFIYCDSDMKPFRNNYLFYREIEEMVFDFSKYKDREIFYNNALSLLFLISSVIVKRDLWNAVLPDDLVCDLVYPHSYIILKILYKGNKLKYIKDFLLYYRNVDNFINYDFSKSNMERKNFEVNYYFEYNHKSDFNNKMVSRALYEINDFSVIANKFCDDEDKNALLNVIFKYSRSQIDVIQTIRPRVDNRKWNKIIKILINAKFPEALLGVFGFLFSNPLLSIDEFQESEITAARIIKYFISKYENNTILNKLEREMINIIESDLKLFACLNNQNIILIKENIKRLIKDKGLIRSFLDSYVYSNVYFMALPLNKDYKTVSGGICYLDHINNDNEKIVTVNINENSNISGSGWIMGIDNLAPEKVFIGFSQNSKIIYYIESNLFFRQDIFNLAQSINKKDDKHGYNFIIPSDVIISGEYDISTIFIKNDYVIIFNNNKKVIFI